MNLKVWKKFTDSELKTSLISAINQVKGMSQDTEILLNNMNKLSPALSLHFQIKPSAYILMFFILFFFIVIFIKLNKIAIHTNIFIWIKLKK